MKKEHIVQVYTRGCKENMENKNRKEGRMEGRRDKYDKGEKGECGGKEKAILERKFKNISNI